MSIKAVISQTDLLMKKSLESLLREFQEVRTGRAHPSLVEDLQVDYYGTPTPLKQMAAVSAPDASSIVIQPWDPSALAEVERAILASKLGITPNNDGKIIRLAVPMLSEERRKEMVKLVKDIAEKGRVSLRTIRRDSNDKVSKLKKDSVVSEDDSIRGLEDIQKITDKYIKEIDSLLEKKTQDLLSM